MDKLGLPPLVEKIGNGVVTWKRLEGLDYENLGYFLSCHLIIEHYFNGYLKIRFPSLAWDTARLTFSQKAALLTNDEPRERWNCIPAVKHMNSLRNRLSHDIEFRITTEHLTPLRSFLANAYERKSTVPAEPKAVLAEFTTMACIMFAAPISTCARRARPRMSGQKEATQAK